MNTIPCDIQFKSSYQKVSTVLDYLNIRYKPFNFTLILFEHFINTTFNPHPSEMNTMEFHACEKENSIQYMGGCVIKKTRKT